MSENSLKCLSMAKYDRLLPRLFSGAARLEILDAQGHRFWLLSLAEQTEEKAEDDESPVTWSDFGAGIGRRRLPGNQLQFRAPLLSREHKEVAWLMATYDVLPSVPLSIAPDLLKHAFADAIAFMQEEIELQWECDQLAIELTERYEELNLLYSTQDQVEDFEEGQEALVRLVNNCADYLDVDLAALICRDRGLVLHHTSKSSSAFDIDAVLELLETTIYDRVESRVHCIVLNETNVSERHRLFAGRSENVLAFPIIDDHSTAIGLLAVVVRKHRRTFSNGDRNLLEVMAKKASRIIRVHHDSLTGLLNRGGFESALVDALASSRNKNMQHCLLHIDIDQLHVVNDLLGHREGDNLIRRIAALLRTMLRDSDLLARLGGDEFSVVLIDCDASQGVAIAGKLCNAIQDQTVISANRQLDVSASIGVASLNPETEGIVGIMGSAEIACSAAKDEGRGRIQLFDESDAKLLRRSEEIIWIERIQQSLRDNQFVLFCQPVLPLSKEENPPHFEILVRMLDGGQILLPSHFLPAAERFHLMPMLDRWVVSNTLRALGEIWHSISATGCVFCINLSGQSLTNLGFLSFVVDEIAETGVAAGQICFEITETAAISKIDDALSFMGALQDIGCRFALDDFGAGLSSFGYLKVLPVDYLKIDGSLIREVRNDDVALSMVTAICQIGRTMGLSIIAEFVGDDETIELLRETGVDFVQGFHIGKPAPLIDITNRLQTDAIVVSA